MSGSRIVVNITPDFSAFILAHEKLRVSVEQLFGTLRGFIDSVDYPKYRKAARRYERHQLQTQRALRVRDRRAKRQGRVPAHDSHL